MTLSELYLTLLIGGAVLLASIAAARAAHRIGLPSLLLFLAVGIIVGEDGLGHGRRRPGRRPSSKAA
ncbi:hypothetical protein ABTX34_27250 [Streptomyces sp. NPDC096538]|uniref:hypothetical protein n=1 Tax=Streptomyces sp. NPDC096538 TaxID=3155427 RepID=UPI003332B563